MIAGRAAVNTALKKKKNREDKDKKKQTSSAALGTSSVEGLTPAQYAELHDLFKLFDTDGSGAALATAHTTSLAALAAAVRSCRSATPLGSRHRQASSRRRRSGRRFG